MVLGFPRAMAVRFPSMNMVTRTQPPMYFTFCLVTSKDMKLSHCIVEEPCQEESLRAALWHSKLHCCLQRFAPHFRALVGVLAALSQHLVTHLGVQCGCWFRCLDTCPDTFLAPLSLFVPIYLCHSTFQADKRIRII